jgi:hypothetical protein
MMLFDTLEHCLGVYERIRRAIPCRGYAAVGNVPRQFDRIALEPRLSVFEIAQHIVVRLAAQRDDTKG